MTQECHAAAGSASKANRARSPSPSWTETAPSVCTLMAGRLSTHPRSASTDAGRAIGVPASTDADIAIVALTSGDAGSSHELEVAFAADLVPASIDAGIAHEREIAFAADLVADCSPWMSPVKDAFRSVEHRGQKRRGPQPGR